MSFNLTTPETQDVKTLETLCELVEDFAEAAMDVATAAADLEPTPEMEVEGDGLLDDLGSVLMAGNEKAGTLALLRLMDFTLRVTFEVAAAVEGAQEKMLTSVPSDLGSEVNADLIEKYELRGLAILVQRVKKGPNP